MAVAVQLAVKPSQITSVAAFEVTVPGNTIVAEVIDEELVLIQLPLKALTL